MCGSFGKRSRPTRSSRNTFSPRPASAIVCALPIDSERVKLIRIDLIALKQRNGANGRGYVARAFLAASLDGGLRSIAAECGELSATDQTLGVTGVPAAI